ncbi:MAG: anaerobic glycerol-3-phosphate dehydrogenase subunit GlpB [Anaerolineales bacterium]|nr:anaerobic glycerol-3-phosphate dehydrogenase subunit GlpB [Anaerolineales bacterium]
MADLVVVGAGLSGLFAATIAAAKGAQVILVAQGRGGLSISHGCIDARAQERAPGEASHGLPPHPLALTGIGVLRSACAQLQTLLSAAELPYFGSLDAQVETLTPLGRRRPTQFAPASLKLPQPRLSDRAAIAGIEGFRDFVPALTVRGLAACGETPALLSDLPLPGSPPRRDPYATDVARLLEDDLDLSELSRLWRPRLLGIEMLGLPAVLGLTDHSRVKSELESALDLPIFEIATLPPNLPGLRLEAALRRAALRAGVTLIEGARVLGRLEGGTSARHALGVVAETAGGGRFLSAGNILLATGGVLNGGLETDIHGRIRESVFEIPVASIPRREDWVGPGLASAHAYTHFGVRVNDQMQPVDAAGERFAANLYAAGGVIAGPDRSLGACRQGIDLATAYRAVEVILG